MTLVAALADLPDLLRLLALPVFGWIAYRDLRTRRVPNWVWLPLVGLGLVALAVEGATVLERPPIYRSIFLRQVALSVGLIVPAAYLLWRIGGFGGADAKALMVIAVVYPTYPVFYGPGFAVPLVRSAAGLFSLTILTNAVLVGAVYPVGLGIRNAIRGRIGARAFVGIPVTVDSLAQRHGRLLETPDGFSRSGLDLDALRMYLRWRGETVETVQATTAKRDPSTVPATTNDPTDGAVGGEATPVTGGETSDPLPSGGDPWAAEQFLRSIDHNAYGTTPQQLRDGLDLLVERDRVWISPGIPFLVPVTVGLAVALLYGDLLVAILRVIGLG